MRPPAALAAALAALSLAAGCGGGAQLIRTTAPEPGPVVSADGAQRAEPATAAPATWRAWTPPDADAAADAPAVTPARDGAPADAAQCYATPLGDAWGVVVKVLAQSSEHVTLRCEWQGALVHLAGCAALEGRYRPYDHAGRHSYPAHTCWATISSKGE